MKAGNHIIVALISWLALFLLPAMPRAAEFRVMTNSVFALASVDAARRALGTEDDFIRGLSEFDRAARMKSEQPVSREQFLRFIQAEVVAWSDKDTARIEQAVAGAREKLSKFKLVLPERVLLVQTTGREEADASYCRGTNIIVFSRHFVNAPAGELETAVIHELFHLLSRNNPELRAKLYALIGFKPCHEIQLPAELDSRHITNPDAPHLDFMIEVTYQAEKATAVPVLYATPERWNKAKGGEFFRYLTWRLMRVEQVNGNWRPARSSGKLMLFRPSDVAGFEQQIGDQPGPVLQAEEILAEYFVKVVEGRGQVPPQVLGGLSRLLGP